MNYKAIILEILEILSFLGRVGIHVWSLCVLQAAVVVVAAAAPVIIHTGSFIIVSSLLSLGVWSNRIIVGSSVTHVFISGLD